MNSIRKLARWAAMASLVGLSGASAAVAEQPGIPAAMTLAAKPVEYGPWRSCRIGGGGYVQNVVTCPTNPRRCYAYVDMGGFYRSDDGGLSWRMLHGALAAKRGSSSIRGLVVDPRDENKLVIAIGSRWDPVVDGIFTSDDGGATWTQTAAISFDGDDPERFSGLALVRNPRNPDELVAASLGDGLWSSPDQGKTWKTLGLEGTNITDVDYDRANPERLWVCALKADQLRVRTVDRDLAGGFFRSEDGGKTWKKLFDDSPEEIVQDPGDQNTLYGTFANRSVKSDQKNATGSGLEGHHALIRVSRDGGDRWADFYEGLPVDLSKRPGSTSPNCFRALAAGPDFVVCGSGDGALYRLSPGQTRWQKIETEGFDVGQWYYPPRVFGDAVCSITIDPQNVNRWFVTDFYGLWRSVDGGKNWRVCVDGIESLVVHTILQDPTDPGAAHIGVSDLAYFTSANGGRNFGYLRYDGKTMYRKDMLHSLASNVADLDLCPKLPNRIYAVSDTHVRRRTIRCLYVSIDRGDHWELSPMIGLPGNNAWECTSLCVSPDDPYTVLLGVSGPVKANGGGVYRSTDGGRSWHWMSQGFADGPPFFWGHVYESRRELCVSPGGAMLAASRATKQVYRYDPQARTWSKVSLALEGPPKNVAADLLHPGRFFLAVENQGLYRSEDGGAQWEKVYDKSAEYVITDHAVANRVAAAVKGGIILSLDGGKTWKELDRRLPSRVENNMAFVGERLLVGSNGSGAFWIALSRKGEQEVAARPVVRADVPVSSQAKAELPRLPNLSMSDGDDAPAGWTVWSKPGGGPFRLRRDTTDFRRGPSSLCLETIDGPGSGTASLAFQSTGEAFQLSGFAKLLGPKSANIALQVIDPVSRKETQWDIVAFIPKAADWKPFEAKIFAPAGSQARIVFGFQGEGRAWLDELAVNPLTSSVFP